MENKILGKGATKVRMASVKSGLKVAKQAGKPSNPNLASMMKAKKLENQTLNLKNKVMSKPKKNPIPVPKGGGMGAGIAQVAKRMRAKVNKGRTISYQRNKGKQGVLMNGKKKMMSSDGSMYSR